MTWEEKFSVIRALDDRACLRMRKPRDWYIDWRVELGGDGLLRSLHGNGRSPREAVEDHWAKILDVAEGFYLAVEAGYSEKRKHYRWGGSLWKELPR